MTETSHRGGDTTSPKAKITTKEREAKALELRTGGASFAAIATFLGLRGGAPAAHKIVKRALESIPYEGVQELRQVELARLDEVEMRLRQKLRSGDVSVANQLLRLSDQRAKLTGMYQAPEGAGDLGAVREVFSGLMASAIAFAQMDAAQAELAEGVIVIEETAA